MPRISQSRSPVYRHRFHEAKATSERIWTLRRRERVQRADIRFPRVRSLFRFLGDLLDLLLCKCRKSIIE